MTRAERIERIMAALLVQHAPNIAANWSTLELGWAYQKAAALVDYVDFVDVNVKANTEAFAAAMPRQGTGEP